MYPVMEGGCEVQQTVDAVETRCVGGDIRSFIMVIRVVEEGGKVENGRGQREVKGELLRGSRGEIEGEDWEEFARSRHCH